MWKAPVNWIENARHFPKLHLFGGGPGAQARGAVKKLGPGPTRWQYAEVVQAALLLMVFGLQKPA